MHPWILGLAALAAVTSPASAQYAGWTHSGSVHVLTTPEGADLPASASEEGFPILVRLTRDFFDFSQARADGADLRFSNLSGHPLPYQIEDWDTTEGTAGIWVRLPTIRGNERQEIKVYWGKSDATSESAGAAVFAESNGYLSVWHMNGPVKDEVGSLETKDVGTRPARGVIGPARHLGGGEGIFGGETITNYPVGAGPHTSELWFRAEKPNGRPLAWGNEHAQGKVVMHFQSPPHVKMDCYFSGANVESEGRMPMNEWVHVAHTYHGGDSRIYVNGVLSAVSNERRSPLALKSPARLFLGGWYHHYDFVGDIDEVRISKVARSADWVKLEHENQKPLQTLTGPLVRPGDAFSVSHERITVPEGGNATFTARADGALKLYWVLAAGGRETTASVDRLSYRFEAGRVTGNQSMTLRCKAIYPSETRTKEIAIAIQEDIEEPDFTLEAPASWDGRSTIEIVPRIRNLAAMKARGAGDVRTIWNTTPFAVTRESAADRLLLKRAQNSGELTVSATIQNGGAPVTRTATIRVTEPKTDPWVVRAAATEEQPEDNQFIARDERNEGTLHFTGKLAADAEEVFVNIEADGKRYRTASAKPSGDKTYAVAVKIAPGLVRYRSEFGTRTAGRETVLRTATNMVCGDAYLIDGQSNALATDTGEQSPAESNAWIRSYGPPPGNSTESAGNLWCHPVWKAEHGEGAELGWWGMELAKSLVRSHKIPIFILNAAAGGTRIDQHQRNAANPTDLSTLYGRMLWRIRQARLTHGIRAILWHQGENDQGADGPTGGYGWETYQPFFLEMAAGWKQDFPNVQHYYVFQIWPDSCSMGGRSGSGDRLRDKQRTLPSLFSNMSIMSTLGIRPPGGCHFPLAGWAEFAHLIQPLIERDHYGKTPAVSITPPNVRRVSRGAGDTLVLEFDQPVVWNDLLAGQFYLDGEKDLVTAGNASGNVLTLRSKAPSNARHLTYLKESRWNQDRLLLGANGIAALTFCEVPIQ